VFKTLCDLLSVSLNFVKLCPKSKVKVHVLNCSDKVKVLGLLKGGMSLVEVGLCDGEK
jgi:hypothetical protein